MDLISTLTQQLGISSDKAEGLAGGALGLIKDQVAQHLGAEQAAHLSSKLPELSQWQAKANALGGSSNDGGMLGALGGLLGGGNLGALGGLLSGAGVDVASAQALLPAVVDFLKDRLDPALVQKILGGVPLLQGLAGSGGLNLESALGGLFGKR